MKPALRLIAGAALALALIGWGGSTGVGTVLAFAPRAQAGPEPAQPLAADLGWAAQVSAGGFHTCAVTLAGDVKCWGSNESGELGDGTTRDRVIPVAVVGLPDAPQTLSAGWSHTCALTTAGGVKCWGWNGHGQLGDGTTTDRLTPVDVVGLSSGVQAISAGTLHTCALTTAGGVKCWGGNYHGRLGDGTTTDRLTPVDVVGLSSGVQAISAGGRHTCALTTAGGVKCWGWNQVGQLGDGTTTDRLTAVDVVGLAGGVQALSAGNGHTCALTTAGGGVCWGGNLYGALGDGTTTTRAVPGAVVGLDAGVRALSSGFSNTCAVLASGGVVCWGHGSVGDGTTANRLTPVAVQGLPERARAVTMGGGHICALLASGAVQCWGGNQYGQLGDGTTTDRLAPTPVILELPYDCAAVSEIPPHECQALVTLFRAANGPFWQAHTDWLQTATPCSWYGVICAAGHVNQLNLPNNNVADILPAALGNLPALQRLDLHGNDLDGPLLAALGNLTALQTLDLHGNAITGALPATYGSLSALQTLDLHDNAITGTLPAGLADLTQLRTLDLSANQLSGPLPADLGRLTAVQTIDLGHNALTGTLPANLGEAAALRTLDLSANQLSGRLPWTWSRLTALERLDLAHNALIGELPPEWSLLPALQYLDLSYNALAGWLPPEYGQWAALTYLDLSFNALRGTLPAAWGALRHIQTLSLNNNQLAGPIPAIWGTLGSAAPPAPQVDTYVWWVPPPPGLYLDLSCNRLSGQIPRALGQNPALQVLNLSSNQLRGALPSELQLRRTPHTIYEDNLLTDLPEANSSQTLPPSALRASLSAPDTALLTWLPIRVYWPYYFYEVSYATAADGPFTVHGQAWPGYWTETQSYTITGLRPNTPYYFRVRTFTPAHGSERPGWGPIFDHDYYQQSNLWSDYTPLVSVTVAATATPTATVTPTPTGTPNPAPLRVFLPLVWRGADNSR